MVHSFHSILTNFHLDNFCRLMKISSCTQSVKTSHLWTKALQLELHDCFFFFILFFWQYKVSVACVVHCVHVGTSVSKLSFLFLLLGCQSCVGAVDTLNSILPDIHGPLKVPGKRPCSEILLQFLQLFLVNVSRFTVFLH